MDDEVVKKLSDKSINILIRNGINDINEIKDLSFEELIQLSGCDFKSGMEIFKYLDELKSNENKNLNLISEDTSLRVFSLSTRSLNCLGRANIKVVRDLINTEPDKIKRIRNLGQLSYDEIMELRKKITKQLGINKLEKYEIVNTENIDDFHNDILHIKPSILKPLSFISIDSLDINSKIKQLFFQIGINKLSEINGFNIRRYGIGNTKIENFFELIRKIINYFDVNKIEDFTFSEEQLSAKLIKYIGIEKTLLRNYKYNTLLEVIEKEQLKDIFNFDTEEQFNTYCFLKNISLNLFDKLFLYSTKFLDDSNNDELVMILNNRFLGRTFDDIGKIQSLTRERIRQKEVKGLNRIGFFINLYNITSYFDTIFELNDRQTIFPATVYHSILYYFERNDIYEKFEFDHKVYYIEKNNYKILKSDAENIVNKISDNDFIYLDDYPEIERNDILFKILVKDFKIEKYNKIITVKGRIQNYLKIYMRLNGTIDCSDKKIDSTIADFENTFNQNISSHRSFIGVLERIAIPIGNKQYVLEEDFTLLDSEIEKQIIDLIETYEFIDCKNVYYNLELKKYNINSPLHLYKYIQKYYGNKYYFGGISLLISRYEDKVSKAAIVLNNLAKSDVPVKKLTLLGLIDSDNISLNIIYEQNKNIIRYDDDTYWLIDNFVYSDEEISVIQKYIEETNDSFTMNNLLIYLYGKIPDFVERNYINDAKSLDRFIKYKLDCLNNFEFINGYYSRIKRKQDDLFEDIIDFEF